MMKVKKFLVFEIIDKLFWLFIMVFPIFGYLLYIPSVKAEKTITTVVDGDVNYQLYHTSMTLIEDSIDLSSSYIVLCDYLSFEYMRPGKIFTTSTGYYIEKNSQGICLYDSSGVELVFLANSGGIRLVSSYMLPHDFGYIISTDNNFESMMMALVGFMIPMEGGSSSVVVDDGILTFSQYWKEKLYLMPDTNNVVGESLQKLFEKGFSFFDFFENSSVFVSILLWIIAVEFAHFFIDFVLFLPRFVHNLLEKYTYGG